MSPFESHPFKPVNLFTRKRNPGLFVSANPNLILQGHQRGQRGSCQCQLSTSPSVQSNKEFLGTNITTEKTRYLLSAILQFPLIWAHGLPDKRQNFSILIQLFFTPLTEQSCGIFLSFPLSLIKSLEHSTTEASKDLQSRLFYSIPYHHGNRHNLFYPETKR